jgi:radical SAM superfamily enzyme YgiQ (UPF0313 family)
MIGLPGEELGDIEEIIALTLQIRSVWEELGRQRGQLGQISLSVNPFVPKPGTPLQWSAMEPVASLKRKYRLLQKSLRPVANVDIHCESLRAAEIQAFLARGDRRVGRVLPGLAGGASLRKACQEAGLDAAGYVTRKRQYEELFPWEIVDQGVDRQHLWEEYQYALAAKTSLCCHPGCRRCGIC